MTASDLKADSFSAYPPEARQLAIAHLRALQATPTAVLPPFLKDIKEYDWKFPVEQQEVVRRVEFLAKTPSSVAAFADIKLPSGLGAAKCAADPRQFLFTLTAWLWSSLQMERYQEAAAAFQNQFQSEVVIAPPTAPRLVMVIIGQGAHGTGRPPFQKLLPHGQLRTRFDSAGAAEAMTAILRERSERHTSPYAHWYLDGGTPLLSPTGPAVTQLFYPKLEPMNKRICERIMASIRNGTGPESLQNEMARLTPADVSAASVTSDLRMQHFALSLLTEGSGTQIFSTSFVQWAAREILSRARPDTVLIRFAPRQRQQSFNNMILAASGSPELDVEGSLVDAEMGAYYTYLEMNKLPGAESASFLVWFEGQPQVFLAGRDIPKGSVSDSNAPMGRLLADLRSDL